MKDNILIAHYNEGETTVIGTLYQYDYGQRIVFEDIDLPQAYEVHFSNNERGESYTVIGDSTGADIPDALLQTGKNIYAWIYLHTGANDGETVYRYVIYVRKRAEPTHETPTPVQQSEITQAIAALNTAVEDAQDAVSKYPKIDEDTHDWMVWDVDDGEYTSTGVSAVGPQGETGETGKPFTIAKTFASISAMNAYTGTDLEAFDYVMIDSGDPEDEDQGKLFCYNSGKNMLDQSTLSLPVFAGWKYNYSLAAEWDGVHNEITIVQVGTLVPRTYVMINPTPQSGQRATVTGSVTTNANCTELQFEFPEDVTFVSGEVTTKWVYIAKLEGPKGADGDPTTLIDDTAGEGDTDKVWSADKTASGLSEKADKADTVLTTTLSRSRVLNTTVGLGSFAFGNNVTASGSYSHAIGSGTVASGQNSYAEGERTTASGTDSHSEGKRSTSSGNYSHAEGYETTASNNSAHAEGGSTTASGSGAHAEGSSTTASGTSSHAEGEGTIANHLAQHAFGRYNVADTSNASVIQKGNYIEIAGNGTSKSARSNARVLDWDGNERLAGNVYVNCNSDSTGGDKVATESYVAGLKGTANGIAELDSNGKVPTAQLPSYVDDVVEGYFYNNNFYSDSSHQNLVTPETSKIYIDLETNKSYRWGGTEYVAVTSDLALGETSSTAYRGDRGKTAYDHATDAERLTTAQTSGFYKFATSGEGHVKSVTAVAKSDLTALGISDTDDTAGYGDTDKVWSADKESKEQDKKANSIVNTMTTMSNMVFFPDGADSMPVELTVQFNATQSGSGDPSPSNIRPVTGESGVVITHRGKNLVDISLADWKLSYTIDDNGEDDSNSSYKYTQYYYEVPYGGKTVTASFESTSEYNTYFRTVEYDASKNFILRSQSKRVLAGTNTITYDLNSDTRYIRIIMPKGINLSNFILEYAPASTGYEPYDEDTYEITFPSGESPVYGGLLKVNSDGTGTFTVTHTKTKMNAWTWTYAAAYGFRAGNNSTESGSKIRRLTGGQRNGSAFCTCYKIANSSTQDAFKALTAVSIGNSILSTYSLLVSDPSFNGDADAFSASLDDNDCIVYEYSTDEKANHVYQLTKEEVGQILSKKYGNLISTSIGSLAEVNYPADPKTYVDNAIAGLEIATTTETQAIINEYGVSA